MNETKILILLKNGRLSNWLPYSIQTKTNFFYKKTKMTSHNKLQTNLGVCAGSPFGSLWQKLYGTGGFAAWSEREWEDISKLRPNVQCNDSRLHRKCQLIIQLY